MRVSGGSKLTFKSNAILHAVVNERGIDLPFAYAHQDHKERYHYTFENEAQITFSLRNTKSNLF